MPFGSGVFLRLLVGELGTPKLAKIFAYSKWLYPYRMQLHGASDLDQRCLKTRNSKDGCTFPPNIFAPTPKITPKTTFWGTFQCKTYYTPCPKKVSHLMFDNNFGNCGPFSKFFHQVIREKIIYVDITNISTSPAICCYTTL